MSDVRMWTSKLGNKYPFDTVQANDFSAQKELKRLRSLHGNHFCADCGSRDNSWASVTHGVFLCIVCSDVHRAVGTHVTKMKGCTGTYLWGPDELERMQNSGNGSAAVTYGSKKVAPSASKDEKMRYVEDKYAKMAFASKAIDLMSTPSMAKHSAREGCEKKTALSQSPSRPVPVPAAPWPLPTQIESAKQVATKSVIPDSFFDELFGDLEEPTKVIECNTYTTSYFPELDLLA